MKQYLNVLIFCILFLTISISQTDEAYAQVEISEVAWMGTATSANDEWIELFNTSVETITLEGWTLTTADKTPTIPLSGTIAGNGFFLLERTNDDTVLNVTADLIYVGALGNAGETLALFNAENSEVFRIEGGSGWPAGDNSTKETMQRVDGKWTTAPATPKAPNVKETPIQTPPLVQEEVISTPPPEPPKIETQPVVVPQIPHFNTTPEPIKKQEETIKVPIINEQVPIPISQIPQIILQATSTTATQTPPVYVEVPKPIQKVEIKKPVTQKKTTVKNTTTKNTEEKSRVILNNVQLGSVGEAYVVEKPSSILEKIWAIPQKIISFIRNLFHR